MSDDGQSPPRRHRTCITEGGLGAATTREIATSAGTNLQAITYHYGSKDRLVARALVETVREWVSPALDVMREPGDPATQMLAAVQALTAHVEQRRGDAPALLEALVAAPRLPELRTAVLDLWTDLRTELLVEVHPPTGGATLHTGDRWRSQRGAGSAGRGAGRLSGWPRAADDRPDRLRRRRRGGRRRGEPPGPRDDHRARRRHDRRRARGMAPRRAHGQARRQQRDRRPLLRASACRACATWPRP